MTMGHGINTNEIEYNKKGRSTLIKLLLKLLHKTEHIICKTKLKCLQEKV